MAFSNGEDCDYSDALADELDRRQRAVIPSSNTIFGKPLEILDYFLEIRLSSRLLANKSALSGIKSRADRSRLQGIIVTTGLTSQSAAIEAGRMMTNAQITYPVGSNDWMLLVRQVPRARIRTSALATLFAGAARLFHLMVSEKSVSEQVASTADKAAQHEFMQRFQHVMVPHLDAAYNFARFLSRDAEASRDIVQEAFLRAYRNFETYRGGDPRSWLFAIVRNCCHVWRQQDRRKARFERHLDDNGSTDPDEDEGYQIASEEDSPETAMIRRSEQQRVRAVISRLPETMREILVLRELEDLSYRQIADIIDAPIGTVMSRLARARREFADTWDAGNKSETAG
jgi:RNA polymerase sigma factor (sigma-70 family)